MFIMSARAETNTPYQAWAGLGQGSLAASRAILASERESAEILVASVLIQTPVESPWVRIASSVLSARGLLIGIRRHRIGGDAYTGLVSINTSFAETARWKRCVPRGAFSLFQG